MRQFLKNNHYDIIHIHSCSIRFLLQTTVTSRRENAGIIIGHAHSIGEATGSLYDRFLRLILKAIISNNINYGMACSKDSAIEKFSKKLISDPNRLKIFPNAIKTDRYSYNVERRISIRGKYNIRNKFVIGIIGRLEKWKNQSFLIDAVNIANHKQEVYLMIVGDGDIREELKEKAATLGISDKIIFTGAVDTAYDYYSAMDLFCLPSYAEGFPFVLVEAQANGLKCLISKEITEETDISQTSEFLPITDPQIWANRIIANIESRLPDESVELVRREYDIKYAAKQLQAFYEKAVAI